jgi:hypothetical protein
MRTALGFNLGNYKLGVESRFIMGARNIAALTLRSIVNSTQF